MCAWHAQQPSSETPLTLTVNVSAKQLNNTGLPKEIDNVCEDCGITQHSLQLEVTESIAMNDPKKAYMILSALKHLGVRISIDDFGTGYSSLSRLRQFPADSLKVDRSFVARIGEGNSEDCEIIRLIVMLAHTLHLQVIAEGIETKEQLDFLVEVGCDLGQGYLFSRPIDHRRAANLMEQTPLYSIHPILSAAGDGIEKSGPMSLQEPRTQVKHRELRWNPYTQEWFCVVCGRTSDHRSLEDARAEMEEHDCQLPARDVRR